MFKVFLLLQTTYLIDILTIKDSNVILKLCFYRPPEMVIFETHFSRSKQLIDKLKTTEARIDKSSCAGDKKYSIVFVRLYDEKNEVKIKIKK